MDKKELQTQVSKFADGGKRAVGRYIREIAVTGMLVALFFLSFSKLIVKDQSILELIANGALLFIIAMLADTLLYNGGQEQGRQHAKYVTAEKEHKALVANLTGEQARTLQAYLNDRAEEDRVERITGMMRAVGLDYPDYLLTQGWVKLDRFIFHRSVDQKESAETITKWQIKAIRKARRIKTTPERADRVLSTSTQEVKRQVRGENVLARRHAEKTAMGMILWTAIFAYFGLDVLANFTWAAFGMFVVKMSCVVSKAVMGKISGFYDVINSAVAYIEYKVETLKGFVNWTPPIVIEESVASEIAAEPIDQPSALERLKKGE